MHGGTFIDDMIAIVIRVEREYETRELLAEQMAVTVVITESKAFTVPRQAAAA